MKLCDIFNGLKNGDSYEFETEFETLYLSDEKGYFEAINDLTRVVRKSFYEEIIKLTKNQSFNQGYFFVNKLMRYFSISPKMKNMTNVPLKRLIH